MIDLKKIGVSALAASLVSLSPVVTTTTANAATYTITSSDIWGDASNLTDGTTIDNPTAADNVVVNGSAVVLTFSDTDGDAKAAGAISGSGAVTFSANTTTNFAQTAASVIVDGNVIVNQSADAKASATATLSSTSATNSVGGTLTITSVDATANDHNVLMDVKGALTVTGLTTLTSARGATGGTGADAQLVIDKAAIFTGGVVLEDGASPGKSMIEFEENNAVTITGVINGAAAGEGLLDITGTGKTFASAIGSTASLLEVQVSAASATFDSTVAATTVDVDATATFTGAVTATTTTVDADATFSSSVTSALTIDTASADATLMGDVTGAATMSTTSNKMIYDATAAQTQTGAITAITDGDGIINIKNTDGLVSFTAIIGASGANRLKELDSDASSKSTYAGKVNVDLLTLDGQVTLQVADNDALDVNFGAASELILAKTITNGQIVLDDVATDFTVASGAKIYAPINLKDGQALILMDGTDGEADDTTVAASLSTAAVDNALIDYAVSVDATNNQSDLTATAKSVSTTATELSVTNNDATALHQAYLSAIDDTNADSGAEGAFDSAFNNSAGSFSATEDSSFTKQITPQEDLIIGSTQAARAITGSVQGVVSNRLASLRSGDAYVAGMSAGDGVSANSMFLQAFGSVIDQDSTIEGSGIRQGYDADTAGVALGVDAITDGGMVVGLSMSMANTDLEGKGSGKATNDIDTYTASIYMDKTGDAGYVEGSLTYGLSENASTRILNTAGLTRNYKGDYNSQQISVKIGGGLPYEAQNGSYVTPFASVTASKIETDAYTETSDTASDNLRLRIDQDDVDSVKGTLGIKAHMDTGSGIPMISFALNNEFGDTNIVSGNQYQGGGSKFQTETAIEEMSATLGLGYTFSSGNTDVNVGYEAEANNEDYLGHYGQIKFSSRF